MNAHAADRDQYGRNLRSLYRKSQFEEFGGREWQHILLALGDVDEEMVTIVNTIVQERTAASLLQQRGARAVPRAQRTQQEVQGINHRISEAKAARSQAKQLDKIVTKEDAQYQQRTSTMSWANWNRLLDDQKAVASTSSYTVNTTTTLLLILLHPYSYIPITTTTYYGYYFYSMILLGPLRSLFVLLLFFSNSYSQYCNRYVSYDCWYCC